MEVKDDNNNKTKKVTRNARRKKNNKNNTRFKKVLHNRVVQVLAVAVVFCTSYSMILDAVTLSAETYCGLEEHMHSMDCYTSKTALCGLEESEGHTHTDDCYDEDGNLICNKEESEGHTHTDNCYISTTALCGLEEHTHDALCLSNPDATESIKETEASLPSNIDEKTADGIAQVAISQAGYSESEENYDYGEDGELRGWNRYGELFGTQYENWNYSFIQFVLYYAGFDIDDLDENLDLTQLDSWFIGNGWTYQSASAELAPGDVVLLKDKENDLYLGICIQYSNGNQYIVVGDINNQVEELAMNSLGDFEIKGSFRLNDTAETYGDGKADVDTVDTTDVVAVESTSVTSADKEFDDASDDETADSTNSSDRTYVDKEKSDDVDSVDQSDEGEDADNLDQTTNEAEEKGQADSEDEDADSEGDPDEGDGAEENDEVTSTESAITLIPVDEDGVQIAEGIVVDEYINLLQSPFENIGEIRTVESTGAQYVEKYTYVEALLDDQVVYSVDVDAVYLEDTPEISITEDVEIILVYQQTEREKTEYIYEDEDIKVTATAAAEAFPDNAAFTITEVTEDSNQYDYETYREVAINQGLDSESLKLYDLAFYMNDSEDLSKKIEVQPEIGSVVFTFEFKNKNSETDSISKDLVHLPLIEGLVHVSASSCAA